MKDKDVAVVIVNYKTADLVKACVASIMSQQEVEFDVVVIDNASPDDSLSKLETLPTTVNLIKNQRNVGFGSACNQGAAATKSRYLYFLNPDAALLKQDDLKKLVRYMDENSEYGLIGTAIQDDDAIIQETAWDHYPSQDKSGTDFSTLPGKIATVLGASMFVRRDAFESITGFDENFFLYAEETDLCLRLRQKGYLIGYFDGVVVSHVGGASEETSPRLDVMKRKKNAKYQFYLKHYALTGLKRILLDEIRNARINILKLKLKKWFGGLNKKQQEKYQRYQMRYELARDCYVKHIEGKE